MRRFRHRTSSIRRWQGLDRFCRSKASHKQAYQSITITAQTIKYSGERGCRTSSGAAHKVSTGDGSSGGDKQGCRREPGGRPDCLAEGDRELCGHVSRDGNNKTEFVEGLCLEGDQHWFFVLCVRRRGVRGDEESVGGLRPGRWPPTVHPTARDWCRTPKYRLLGAVA